MKKVILVTGVLGFLGRHVASYFKEKNYFIIGIDREKCNKKTQLIYKIDKFINTNINLEMMKKIDEKVDYIVHCAGSSSVGYSIDNPYITYKDTVDCTYEILEYIRTVNPNSILIYPSSVAVYGEKADRPIRENEYLDPISPYGYFKKIVEELCELYSKLYNLDISIIRFYSIYGTHLKKQLLWDACMKFSSNDNNIFFFGTGEETRDWIHVQDALSLIASIIENKPKGIFIINGASGRRIRNKDIILEVAQYFGKTQNDFRFIKKNKIGDPLHYHADIAKALNIGWQPTVLLENGIKDYVRWFKKEIDKNSVF